MIFLLTIFDKHKTTTIIIIIISTKAYLTKKYYRKTGFIISAQNLLLRTERKTRRSLPQAFRALHVIPSFSIFLVNVNFYWNVAS
jgi:hypothetical protein